MSEQPNPSNHADHDLLLVAALADREATGAEAERARALIDACGECATLHADLVTLSQATSQLPPIPRPRDFQLRPVDAQRLRPNLVRRLLGSFGTARDGFSRPLALGLTTLGLAGLLVGVIPGALSLGGGGATSATPGAATEQERTDQMFSGAASAGAPANPAAVPGASNEPAQGEGAGSDGPFVNAAPDGLTTDDGTLQIAGERDLIAGLAEDAGGVSQLVVISGTLLIVGLGLFALRWTSRRFGG